jgi:uncharacterized protein (UPF0276 family)
VDAVAAAAVVMVAAVGDAPPALGLGIGWRRETAGLVLTRDDLGFIEVIAESLATHADLPLGISEARRRGLSVVPHGISLSLGGGERPDLNRLSRLAAVAERVGAPLVSDHVAFVRAGGSEAGHLLPVPRTRAMLDVLVENVRMAQDELPVPLAVESPAALFDWPEAELDEADFLSELTSRTGCWLLVDVANLHVNGANHRYDPLELMDRLPLDRVAYVHAAGGVEHEGILHDTHTHPLWPEVDVLVEEMAARIPIPGLMLERDGGYPPMDELAAELDRLAAARARGDERRNRRLPGADRHRAARPPAVAAPSRHQPVDDDRRAAVIRHQHDLIRALVEDGPTPPGFDPGRIDATVRALRHKRCHETAAAWPALAGWLGTDFEPLFLAWAGRNPPASGGARADGLRLVRDLPRGQRWRLPRPVRAELTRARAAMR